MEELREYLLDQDIWEREVDELLGNFNDKENPSEECYDSGAEVVGNGDDN